MSIVSEAPGLCPSSPPFYIKIKIKTEKIIRWEEITASFMWTTFGDNFLFQKLNVYHLPKTKQIRARSENIQQKELCDKQKEHEKDLRICATILSIYKMCKFF
jgi:hypothetical protein